MTDYKRLEENPHGLHARYRVEKLYGEADPNARYFVLRLDKGGDDPIWTAACRVAARRLAMELLQREHLAELAGEICRFCDALEKEPQ